MAARCPRAEALAAAIAGTYSEHKIPSNRAGSHEDRLPGGAKLRRLLHERHKHQDTGYDLAGGTTAILGRGQAQPNRMKIRIASSRAMIPMTSITCGHGVIGFSCGCHAELVDIALPIERGASVQRLAREENVAISRITAQYVRMEK